MLTKLARRGPAARNGWEGQSLRVVYSDTRSCQFSWGRWHVWLDVNAQGIPCLCCLHQFLHTDAREERFAWALTSSRLVRAWEEATRWEGKVARWARRQCPRSQVAGKRKFASEKDKWRPEQEGRRAWVERWISWAKAWIAIARAQFQITTNRGRLRTRARFAIKDLEGRNCHNEQLEWQYERELCRG